MTAEPESASLLRNSWTRIEGLRIFVRVATDFAPEGARPVVLVHGYGVSGHHLIPTAELLAPHVPVYIPDLPGHGKSDTPRRALSLSASADFLAAWMDAINISGTTLLGSSYGCQIIADLAIRRRDLIDCAVLVGPTVDPALRSLPHLLPRLLLDAFRERPRQVLITLRDYVRFGPRRSLETFREMIGDRIEDKLPRMTMPTLVVRGRDDPIVSQTWVEQVAAMLPRGRLVVIPGAAHAVAFDVPKELAGAVLPFLADQQDIAR